MSYRSQSFLPNDLEGKSKPSLISVCVPIYNGETYLRESIECILQQVYQQFEVIIVDDRSVDNSFQIACEYADRDQRVRCFQNETNLGLVGNWNRCLELASGEWIKFQFQDDLMDPKCLESLMSHAVEQNVRMIICDRNYLFESDSSCDQYMILPKLNAISKGSRKIHKEEMMEMWRTHFLGPNFIGEPIVGFFHREIFATYGNYDKNLKQICDFEFFIRVATNETFYFVDEALVSFRVHSKSETFANKSVKTDITVSARDRVYLGEKVLSYSFFECFRQDSKRRGFQIKKVLIQNFSRYVNRFGALKLIKLYGLIFFVKRSSFSQINIKKALQKSLSF
jgi:glycosyltransferase involved in cell wall biosynthesis